MIPDDKFAPSTKYTTQSSMEAQGFGNISPPTKAWCEAHDAKKAAGVEVREVK